MLKAKSRSKAIAKNFWKDLDNVVVTSEEVDNAYMSDVTCPAQYKSLYRKYFTQIYNQINHLMDYAVNANNTEGVLVMPQLSDVEIFAKVDGILLKGEKYVKAFLRASDLDAAIEFIRGDIESVSFDWSLLYPMWAR